MSGEACSAREAEAPLASSYQDALRRAEDPLAGRTGPPPGTSCAIAVQGPWSSSKSPAFESGSAWADHALRGAAPGFQSPETAAPGAPTPVASCAIAWMLVLGPETRAGGLSVCPGSLAARWPAAEWDPDNKGSAWGSTMDSGARRPGVWPAVGVREPCVTWTWCLGGGQCSKALLVLAKAWPQAVLVSEALGSHPPPHGGLTTQPRRPQCLGSPRLRA